MKGRSPLNKEGPISLKRKKEMKKNGATTLGTMKICKEHLFVKEINISPNRRSDIEVFEEITSKQFKPTDAISDFDRYLQDKDRFSRKTVPNYVNNIIKIERTDQDLDVNLNSNKPLTRSSRTVNRWSEQIKIKTNKEKLNDIKYLSKMDSKEFGNFNDPKITKKIIVKLKRLTNVEIQKYLNLPLQNNSSMADLNPNKDCISKTKKRRKSRFKYTIRKSCQTYKKSPANNNHNNLKNGTATTLVDKSTDTADNPCYFRKRRSSVVPEIVVRVFKDKNKRPNPCVLLQHINVEDYMNDSEKDEPEHKEAPPKSERTTRHRRKSRKKDSENGENSISNNNAGAEITFKTETIEEDDDDAGTVNNGRLENFSEVDFFYPKHRRRTRSRSKSRSTSRSKSRSRSRSRSHHKSRKPIENQCPSNFGEINSETESLNSDDSKKNVHELTVIDKSLVNEGNTNSIDEETKPSINLECESNITSINKEQNEDNSENEIERKPFTSLIQQPVSPISYTYDLNCHYDGDIRVNAPIFFEFSESSNSEPPAQNIIENDPDSNQVSPLILLSEPSEGCAMNFSSNKLYFKRQKNQYSRENSTCSSLTSEVSELPENEGNQINDSLAVGLSSSKSKRGSKRRKYVRKRKRNAKKLNGELLGTNNHFMSTRAVSPEMHVNMDVARTYSKKHLVQKVFVPPELEMNFEDTSKRPNNNLQRTGAYKVCL